eukprot:5015371-Pyramimonas_sp.AAC.1
MRVRAAPEPLPEVHAKNTGRDLNSPVASWLNKGLTAMPSPTWMSSSTPFKNSATPSPCSHTRGVSTTLQTPFRPPPDPLQTPSRPPSAIEPHSR